MITLRKLLNFLAVAHVGAAFVALVTTYNNGYISDFGMSGWLAHTPIGSHFDLEANDSMAADVSQGNVPGFFRFMFDLGDTVNSFASFNYGFLGAISTENFLFLLVMGLRLLSIGIWFAVGGALVKTVLDSNLLSSKVGLVVLFGGIGVLSALGIFF